MKNIQELIVVEGKNDSAALKRYFICDTIETGGLALDQDTIELIKEASRRRGVIILTDPDSPGNRIRSRINEEVPGCKNAFVEKQKARTTKKVGVEHADRDTLEEALASLVTFRDKPEENITSADIFELGLSGSPDSAVLREKAGAVLHIGNGNAKTMRYRLNCLGITKEELENVINDIKTHSGTIPDKGDSEEV